MPNRELLFGMGIALWMVACSETPLATSRDAAVEVQPAPDVSANTDLVPSHPDSATLALDTAAPDVLGRDAAAPDLADAALADLPARDAAGADAAVPDALVRDAVLDVADVVARDATIADVATVEAASDMRDSAGPDAVGFTETRPVSTHPFAGRTFRIDDMNPAPTPDPTCTPSGPASAANLTFSSDVITLTGVASSGSTAFRFSATAGPESNKLTYHVTNLNGGQVFFERDQGVYVGQVVLYGSGVPVMWCLRGALTPQP
jgi:hypothetical protein